MGAYYPVSGVRQFPPWYVCREACAIYGLTPPSCCGIFTRKRFLVPDGAIYVCFYYLVLCMARNKIVRSFLVYCLALSTVWQVLWRENCKTTHMRIRDEIKFVYSKKQLLNHQIYHLHLLLADTWNNSWQYMLHAIESKLQNEAQNKYQNLDRNLNKLIQTQTNIPTTKTQFLPDGHKQRRRTSIQSRNVATTEGSQI
jgi:hypothetical protein